MAICVKQCFEQVIQTHLFPRSQILIRIHVLQHDGGALMAALNATTLALIDAGIPLLDYVCATTTGCIGQEPVLDLNLLEETSAYDCPKFTLAMLPRTGKVVLVHLESRMHWDRFQQVKQVGVHAAKGQVGHAMDRVVRERTQYLISKRDGIHTTASMPTSMTASMDQE